MLLLLLGTAFAAVQSHADVALAVEVGEQRFIGTFADARPGPLPGLVLPYDERHELRVDVTVLTLSGERSTFDVQLSLRRPGRGRARPLRSLSLVSGRDAVGSFSMAEGDGPALDLRIAAVRAERVPPALMDDEEVEAGPFAGCRMMQHGPATALECAELLILHREMPAPDGPALMGEAAALAETLGEALQTGGLQRLQLGEEEVDAYIAIVRLGAVGPDVETVTAWFIDGETAHQVSCLPASPAGPACRDLLPAFRRGVAAALR